MKVSIVIPFITKMIQNVLDALVKKLIKSLAEFELILLTTEVDHCWEMLAIADAILA